MILCYVLIWTEYKECFTMEIVCYRMTSVVKVNYGHNFSQPKNKYSSFISNTLFKMGARGFGLFFCVIIIEAAGALGDSRK